jgi:hypothetical protein
MHLVSSHQNALPRAIVTIVLVALTATDALAVEPREVVEATATLEAVALDKGGSLKVDGLTIERPGVTLTFETGRMHAIVRETGDVVGAVFIGEGNAQFVIPAGVETRSWQMTTKFSPLEQSFTAAHLRFSDGSADALFTGDMTGPEDTNGAAFRIYDGRTEALSNPLWTRWAPNLIVDELLDMYGGGSQGGYFLADLKLSTDRSWLSYLHNPRGALLPDETTALYFAHSQGQAPPDLDVVASFGAPASPGADYDVLSTDLDVTFPPGGQAGLDLVRAEIQSEVQVLNPRDAPLHAVVFELDRRRELCVAEPGKRDIKISRVRDHTDTLLPVIHRGSQLLVVLPEPVEKGGVARLRIDYGGPMTQGIPYTSSQGHPMPDTFFSELGPWAWYPRNPRPDHFASRIEVHTPRFMRAVAPGDLLEEREGEDGWHFAYEEPGGLKTLTLVVGALRKTELKDQGSNPRIIAWGPQGTTANLKGSTEMVRAMLDFTSAIWGPFPYSTLHVVEGVPYPMMNWQVGAEGRDGGGWSCLPPGHLRAWQGFVDGPSGMLMSASPITAPSHDLVEARAIDALMVEPLEINKYLQVAQLTRQWWGHRTPPRTYRDVWITESATSWTALLFLSRVGGLSALKERTQTMRRLTAEVDETAPPVLIGERQGRAFAFQTWSRAALLWAEIADRVGSQKFLAISRELLSRGSGKGIGADLFLEAVEAAGGRAMRDQATHILDGGHLPTIEYTSTFDRKTNEVVVEFAHTEDMVPASIAIQIHIQGTKLPLVHRVLIDERRKTLRVTPEGKVRKIDVDPMRAALVRKLKKVRRLPDAPEAE